MDFVVGSSYPGAGEGPKGPAVRRLKRHVSWVQTVVRQVGLLSAVGVETWGEFFLVNKLLLSRVIGIENSANNGEILFFDFWLWIS